MFSTQHNHPAETGWEAEPSNTSFCNCILDTGGSALVCQTQHWRPPRLHAQSTAVHSDRPWLKLDCQVKQQWVRIQSWGQTASRLLPWQPPLSKYWPNFTYTFLSINGYRSSQMNHIHGSVDHLRTFLDKKIPCVEILFNQLSRWFNSDHLPGEEAGEEAMDWRDHMLCAVVRLVGSTAKFSENLCSKFKRNNYLVCTEKCLRSLTSTCEKWEQKPEFWV